MAKSEGEALWNPEGFVTDFEAAAGGKQEAVGILWYTERAMVVLLHRSELVCTGRGSEKGDQGGTYTARHIYQSHLVAGLHAELFFLNDCLSGSIGWIYNILETLNGDGGPGF